MPLYHRNFKKGRFVITFEINFPQSGWIKPDQVRKLEDLLPAREKHVPSDIGEEVHLSEMSELPQRGYGHSSYYDDDDDDPRHGGGVQCQTS